MVTGQWKGGQDIATMVDVAARAGVSPSTVSYVLSGKRPIGEQTRLRVLEAARELDGAPCGGACPP